MLWLYSPFDGIVERMTESAPIRTVTVAGRRTSLRLDDQSWQVLHYICREQRTTLPALMTSIDRQRGNMTRSNATRQYIVRYLRSQGDRIPDTASLVSERARRHRASVLSTATTDCREGYERKIWFSPEIIPKMETGTLEKIWRTWIGLRAERDHRLTLEDFALAIGNDLGLDGEAGFNAFDTSPEDPFNFRILTVNQHAKRFAGADLTGHRIGDYPVGLHARGLQTDFNLTKREVQPMYQILHQRFRGFERLYSRIVLPFSTDGQCVDRLASIVQRIIPHRPIADFASDRRSARAAQPES